MFALFFVDRLWLYRFDSEDAAGLYSLSVKLAAVVIFTVRAFQYAWPPLAYSIADDDEARRVYARITTYYVLFTGLVVAGLALLGRWVVRLFAAPEFFEAHEALPWVALGWALYGLFLVLVAMAGRAQRDRAQLPRRAVRAGGQRRAAGAARRPAGDRGRRARAGRRVRRHARGDVRAHPRRCSAVAVRVGAPGARGRRGGRDRRGGRAAAAHRRRRRASWPARRRSPRSRPCCGRPASSDRGSWPPPASSPGGPARAWGVARSEPARTPRGGG